MLRLEPFQYFQLLSLLLAVLCRKGLRRFVLGVFIPILVIVNLVEIVGVNYKHSDLIPNYSIYNVYILVKTPLYLYLYSRILQLRDNEITAFRVLCGLCCCFILFNFFFWQGTEEFNTYSAILTELINIVFSGLALLRLYMMETNNVALFKEPWFWVNAANMLFALLFLVLLGLLQYIRKYNINIRGETLYHVILPPANIILYSLYSYAFIVCRQRIVKWSPSS